MFSGKIFNKFTGRLIKRGTRTHKNYMKKLENENKNISGGNHSTPNYNGNNEKNNKKNSEKNSNNKKNNLKVFDNADKKWHEKWENGRDIMNIPHPFRCVLCGPPNCGKTSMIFNLLVANKPYFKEVIVIHCDPEYTKEYDNVNAIMTNEIPSPDQFEGKKKTLVILDDLEYKNLTTEQKKNLDRLFGFVSTHKNISVCLSAQDVFNIPSGVRRCSNLWVLWKINDLDAISRLARRVNYSSKQINQLFKENINGTHDSIMIDNTHKTPYPLRKNGTQPIKLNQDEDYY